MTANFLLGKDQLAIDGDIKDAAAARNELPTTDEVLNRPVFQDFVRQTDGIGLVPSSSAILDDNVHDSVLHDAHSLQQLASIDIRQFSIKKLIIQA